MTTASDLDAIRKRSEVHEIVYERPHRYAACWMEYRTKGRCSCDAEADMAALLDMLAHHPTPQAGEQEQP